MSRYIVVFVTCGSEKEARKIARGLLNKKLIACANIIGGVKSFFWWKGKIDRAKETLLIIKTIGENFKKAKKEIKKLHSYEVPEIIALPIAVGDEDYLKWMGESVKK